MYIYLWTRMGRITSSGVSTVEPGEADVSKIRQGILTCIMVRDDKASIYSRNPADKSQPWKAVPEIAPLYVHNVPGETAKKAAPIQKGLAKAKPPVKGKTQPKKAEAQKASRSNPLEGSLENPSPDEESPKEDAPDEEEKPEDGEEEDESKEKEGFDWAPEA